MKSKRAKAVDITKDVKEIVWQRDGERCIFCGTHEAMPNAHIVPRSKGGLGVANNIVTLCMKCHFEMDQTEKRGEMLERAKEYIRQFDPEWTEESVTYSKY